MIRGILIVLAVLEIGSMAFGSPLSYEIDCEIGEIQKTVWIDEDQPN